MCNPDIEKTEGNVDMPEPTTTDDVLTANTSQPAGLQTSDCEEIED